MENPARLDFGADRFVVFKRTLVILDYDFTSAAFAIQVRDRKNGGTVRANLTTVTTAIQGVRLIYAGSATVSAHITAGRLTSDIYNEINLATGVNYVAGDAVTLSQIDIRIDKTTMEAMPLSTAEPEDDRVLQWDLQVSIGGGDPDKYAGGDFVVRGGVVQ